MQATLWTAPATNRTTLRDIIARGAKTEPEYAKRIEETRAAIANGELTVGDYEITVRSGPDGNGNHFFCVNWIEEGSLRPRGQVFVSNLAQHRKDWEERKTRLTLA
jgi:hypothetical protein